VNVGISEAAGWLALSAGVGDVTAVDSEPGAPFAASSNNQVMKLESATAEVSVSWRQKG